MTYIIFYDFTGMPNLAIEPTPPHAKNVSMNGLRGKHTVTHSKALTCYDDMMIWRGLSKARVHNLELHEENRRDVRGLILWSSIPSHVRDASRGTDRRTDVLRENHRTSKKGESISCLEYRDPPTHELLGYEGGGDFDAFFDWS